MTVQLKLTRLPNLNDTIVIKQENGHFFIAAPDSIVIDKAGFIILIEELLKLGYITREDWIGIENRMFPIDDWEKVGDSG